MTETSLQETNQLSPSESTAQLFVLAGVYRRKLGQLAWINKRHVYNYPISDLEKETLKTKWEYIKELWLYYGPKGLRHVYKATFIGVKSRNELLAGYPDYPSSKNRHGDYYAVYNVESIEKTEIEFKAVIVRKQDFMCQSPTIDNTGSRLLKKNKKEYKSFRPPTEIASLAEEQLFFVDIAFNDVDAGSISNTIIEKSVFPLSPIIRKGFTFIDLFAGIGGFHQAMSALGGKCVFACDINKQCRKVYAANYLKKDEHFIVGEDINKAIRDNVIPQFDLLCGGFPCQTFSKAGKRNGFKIVVGDDGEKDERGGLFFRIIDILKEHPECKYIVLENVRNLADNKDNWRVVCEELKCQGFVITEDPIITSPHRFGIPQVRERVYILGIKKDAITSEELRKTEKITFEMLNVKKHYKKCPKNCVPMLLDVVADPRYFVPKEIEDLLNIWEEFLQNVEGIKSPFWLHKAGLGITEDAQYMQDKDIGYAEMPAWKQKLVWKSRVMYNNNRKFIDFWANKYSMRKRSLIHQKFEWNASRDCSRIKDGIIQIRQSGVRVKNPDYFPSLVAMNNIPIVWDKRAGRYRYLSPKEAAKLQSFNQGFVFDDSDQVSYRQLGNSINVKLVKMFARALLRL